MENNAFERIGYGGLWPVVMDKRKHAGQLRKEVACQILLIKDFEYGFQKKVGNGTMLFYNNGTNLYSHFELCKYLSGKFSPIISYRYDKIG